MRPLLQGAIAGVGVAVATCLQMLLRYRFHVHTPYPFFFLAVMFSAWFAGRVGAAVALVLGTVASTVLLTWPHDGVRGSFEEIALNACLYLTVSGVASYCIVALRIARERAETILGSIGDGVIRVDRAGRVAYLNPVAARLAGVTPRNAAGLPFADVVRLLASGTESPIPVDVARHSSARGLMLERADNTRVPVEIGGSPVPGDEGHSVITIRDLSERSRADKLQHETEHRFRVLADSVPVLIWTATPDKRFDYFNRPWLEFTGRAPGEGAASVWADCIHPDDRERCLRAFHDCFDARRGFRLEYRLRRRDGQYRWVFDTGVPRFAATGEFLGAVGSAVDVTDRKEVEERFRTLVETANEGIWMVAPDAHTIYANDRMARMLGCTPGELGDRTVLEFCFPDDVEPAAARIAANLAGHAESYDFSFRRIGGEEVIVRASTSPVRDPEGKAIGAVGMYSDVTERRRAVVALSESEERFRQIADNIDEVFWIRDLASGRIVYVSPAYERLWGRSLTALLARPEDWIDAVHPGDRERVRHVFHSGGTAFDEEYRILQPDGTLRWVRDRGFSVAGGDGRVYRMIGLAGDITARKQAETSVRESEAKLRALLESASQGVVATDETGRILLINAKTEEMFGYSRSELIGRQLEILLPPGLRNAHEGHRAGYFARPRARSMGVGLYLAGRKKRGDEFPVEISLSYLDEAGARIALALITDITERKRFDEKLRETAKLESLGVLAGGIAHDFNNILTGILGNASLALEIIRGQDELRPLLQSVVESSERAAHLTHQMLAYSGKGRFIVRPVDLSAELRNIVQLVESSIPRSVELQFHLASGLPFIEADVAQLQQLTMNLVLNGAEASGDRPGTVSVRTGITSVSPPGLAGNVAGNDIPAGDYVALEVRDTGSGMDEDTRARMFDPFFTTKFTGRGLGLAATLGIVRGHQGAILVDTVPGRGTAVTVLFPPSADGARAAVVPEPAAASAPGRGTVLVVDDEEVVRNTARASLERAGYRVLLAENGESAVRIFRFEGRGIALIVLDMTMPVMSGKEALGRLRELDPSVKIVVSSGYSELEAGRHFEGQDIAGFVQKPYTSARLLDRVAAVLAGSSAPWPAPPGSE